MTAKPKSYKVLVGIDYPPEKRAEPGDVVDDIPEESARWLLKQGLIELAKPARKKES